MFSFINAQNDDYDDYDDDELKDTVIIDGMKYARVINDDYFDNLEYDEGMWTLAPSYGLGIVKGSAFSSIPSGYSLNIITPFYGFGIGPCTITYLLHLERFNAEHHKFY